MATVYRRLAAALAGWILRRTDGKDDAVAALHEIAAAVFGFGLLSLEVHHFFHRENFSVATFDMRQQGTWSSILMLYAIMLLLLAWYRGRRLLSQVAAVAGVAALLVAMIFGGLVTNPLWHREAVGPLPLWNWLLYAYALPAALALVLAELFLRDSKVYFARIVQACALAGLFLLVAMQVHHYFFRLNMALLQHLDIVTLVQWGTWTAAWLAYAALLLLVDWRWPRPPLRLVRRGALLVAAVTAVLVQVFFANPLHTNESLGEHVVWNWLLYVYGLPAALLVILGRMLRQEGELPLRAVAGVTAMLLLFVMVSLEVRQAFHGAVLSIGETSTAELYSYSAAWLGYGALLLLVGIATAARPFAGHRSWCCSRPSPKSSSTTCVNSRTSTASRPSLAWASACSS